MPPIKAGTIVKTIEKSVVKEIDESLPSPAQLEKLFEKVNPNPPKKIKDPKWLDVDPPPEKIITKQRQPKYIEVDEPIPPPQKKPPRPSDKLDLLPDKPSEIVEAANDASDFWMPDPKMFPGSELLIKAGNAGLAALLAALANKLREKEKLKNISPEKQSSESENPQLEVPITPYNPPLNSGYDFLPEPVNIPGESFEVPFPGGFPSGEWLKCSYGVNHIKGWFVQRDIFTGESQVSQFENPENFTNQIELIDPQSFGLIVLPPSGSSGQFAGQYYVWAKGIRGVGLNVTYSQLTRIWLPTYPGSIARFEGNSGAYPIAWDIYSFMYFHTWYSPAGVTVTSFRIEPPKLPVYPARLPENYQPPTEEEQVACDLSSIQQGIRYVIQQNNSIQASVNGAQLGINANIDTLKPPLNTAVNNTGQILNVTGTTQTTVNSTASQVNAIKQGVDNIPPKLNGIQSALDDMGPKVNSIKSTIDDIPDVLANHGNMLNNISGRVQDTFNKVGEVLTKMGERFDRIARWLRLPQLLSALTLIVTLHNAAMLFSNLIQSLGEIIDIGLNVIGLKDENDQEFNISQILGKNGNDLAASILGAEATGKIGNALRKAGVVAESAYNWLPETINLAIANQTAFRGVLNNLRNLNDTADSLGSAVSETRNIQTEFNEMKEKKKSLTRK